MCGGGGSSTPKADPVAEREKAQAEATQKANQELLTTARRKRIGKGLLATGEGIGSVMALDKPKVVSTAESPFKYAVGDSRNDTPYSGG